MVETFNISQEVELQFGLYRNANSSSLNENTTSMLQEVKYVGSKWKCHTEHYLADLQGHAEKDQTLKRI